jgi:hypothetical protein
MTAKHASALRQREYAPGHLGRRVGKITQPGGIMARLPLVLSA